MLNSVPPISADPLPEEPPVNPDPVGIDQLYDVPAGTIPSAPFTGTTENPLPLQTVAVMLFTWGLGLRLTVTGNTGPVQPPETGVTL